MQIQLSRWRVLVSLLALVFILTACYRGDRDDTSIGVESAANPSPTTAPTQTPDVSDTPAVTATTLDLPVVERPSETATETPTVTEPATLVAQAQNPTPTPDDLSLTATERIRIITATVFAQETATAIDQGIGQPTQTPFATAEPTTNPFITPTPVQQQPQPSGGGATGPDCIHQVRAGETMWGISDRLYGVPVQQIASRNNITNIRLITVGQQLTIPNCGQLAQSLSPPTAQQPGGNQPQPANPNQPATSFIQHTVQQYETLFQISMLYNVPVQQIASANGITNFDYIQMTDVLQIPVTSTTTTGGSTQPQQPQQQFSTATQQPLQTFSTATWTPLPPDVGG